jgi:hypothetical protein
VGQFAFSKTADVGAKATTEENVTTKPAMKVSQTLAPARNEATKAPMQRSAISPLSTGGRLRRRRMTEATIKLPQANDCIRWILSPGMKAILPGRPGGFKLTHYGALATLARLAFRM